MTFFSIEQSKYHHKSKKRIKKRVRYTKSARNKNYYWLTDSTKKLLKIN